MVFSADLNTTDYKQVKGNNSQIPENSFLKLGALFAGSGQSTIDLFIACN